MTKRWNVTKAIETAHLTQVFSGGACNVLNDKGILLRNPERDSINDWLSEKGVVFFDPQIHPDTHGEEYSFPKHARLEAAARTAATLNLYEISPRTFGGITSLEIAADHFRWHEPMVLYYSDGDTTADRTPNYSERGFPLFIPCGLHSNQIVMLAHYREMRKNANNMRSYLMSFARDMDALTITFNQKSRANDITIAPDRMHAADLFTAVVQAAAGSRTYVNFVGHHTYRDDMGNPLFYAPSNPPEVQLHALLDQYQDEGNELRKRIAELVTISVFVRVVYTQRSAILALEELLKLKHLL